MKLLNSDDWFRPDMPTLKLKEEKLCKSNLHHYIYF